MTDSELEAQERDAARYRAIKARHAHSIVSRFIDKRGYSSLRAPAQIDAWADAAAQEVADWDAKTPDEQMAYFTEQVRAAVSAHEGRPS